MYSFYPLAVDEIKDQFDENDYSPFVSVKWLQYLKELKGIKPVYLGINYEGNLIGYFFGGITHFCGIRVLGSPFWGWIGQHMGFILLDEVNKPELIDDLIDYALREFRVLYVQITDLKFDYSDVQQCKHKLVEGERYRTCYIDLTKSEEELFKNLKSGYRTCVRKFEKVGGVIQEDYSEEFIEEHHKQLADVFDRQRKKCPNYRQKMKMMFNSPDFLKGATNTLGIYSIKAMLPAQSDDQTLINVASSYYIHNGYMAMFASNASYSEYLKNCPNQALMWNAIVNLKRAGIKIIDMGGSGAYKLNYTDRDWEPKPIMIFAKNKLIAFIIVEAKRSYGKVSSFIGKFKNGLKEIIKKENI